MNSMYSDQQSEKTKKEDSENYWWHRIRRRDQKENCNWKGKCQHGSDCIVLSHLDINSLVYFLQERQERLKSLGAQFSVKSSMMNTGSCTWNSSEGGNAEVLGDSLTGYIINVVREQGEEPVRIPPSISAKLKPHQVQVHSSIVILLYLLSEVLMSSIDCTSFISFIWSS